MKKSDLSNTPAAAAGLSTSTRAASAVTGGTVGTPRAAAGRKRGAIGRTSRPSANPSTAPGLLIGPPIEPAGGLDLARLENRGLLPILRACQAAGAVESFVLQAGGALIHCAGGTWELDRGDWIMVRWPADAGAPVVFGELVVLKRSDDQ
jgi:hypothetical protein